MSAHDERSPLGGTQNVLPASQYLQDRLNERRARNTRPKRARHTDFGPQKGRDDDIFLNEAEESRHARMFDSSPVVASSRASDAGSAGRRRGRGVRDMDDQMDQLNKQNFDLKMELDHRRQQTIKLQQQIESMREQVERAQMVEDEHKELLRINSQLVEELEKRDKAVEEAMDIICDLEDRVAGFEERNDHTRPSTANADSGYAGTETHEHEPPSSPPELNAQPKTPHLRPAVQASNASQKLQGLLNGQTPAKPRREPTILSQQKPSTHALRSVYMESAQKLHPVKSFQSLLSKQETRTEDGDDILNSPRLSVLSESSFPSIYSPKHMSPDRYPWEDAADETASNHVPESQDHRRHDSIKRVSQWMTDRGVAEATPSKSNNLSTPLADGVDDSVPPPASRRDHQDTHYQSLNDALVSAASKSPDLLQEPATKHASSRARKQRPAQQHRPTSFAGPIFGEPMLPPTPDSASTRMLRASRSSNIADDRSLLDTTPAPIKQEALVRAPEHGVRTAPRQMRSSVEMRNAFASNLNFRNGNLDGQLHDDDDTDEEYDARSETVKDLSLDYDGYPDGKSIVMGTPSRFLKHARPPVGDTTFVGNGDDTSATATRSPPRRRRSSDQIVSSPTKPRLSRVETSPTIFSSLGRIVSGGKKAPAGARASDESVTSPHSIHSGSSSNRTVVANEQQPEMAEVPRDRARLISTGLTSPTRSRASPSPGRSLSQKTAGLFRRLSNSHGEKPPLPTLTSAPSSTFANTPPAELKRPKTSHSADRPPTSSARSAVQRPPSAREIRRPPMQIRTKTEPATGRPHSSAAVDRPDKEKRSLFSRSNSLKKTSEPTGDNQSTRGPTKRRGSLREAVTSARRPWR